MNIVRSRTILLILLSFLCAGCATTYTRINEFGQTVHGTVKFQKPRVCPCLDVVFINDSVFPVDLLVTPTLGGKKIRVYPGNPFTLSFARGFQSWQSEFTITALPVGVPGARSKSERFRIPRRARQRTEEWSIRIRSPKRK